MGMVIQCHETDGFHLPEIFGEDTGEPYWGFVSQNDLLLVSKEKVGINFSWFFLLLLKIVIDWLHIFVQFGDDTKLPTTYAFALVEQRLPDKIRLRMQLNGETKRVDTNEVTTSKSLLKVRSLIVEQKKTWYIMKVLFFFFVSCKLVSVPF